MLGYSYDVGSRLTALTLPAQLGGGQTTYGSDPRTGQVALVTDRLGLRVRAHYDAMGRLDSLLRRKGLSDPVTETRTYGLASRLKTDLRLDWGGLSHSIVLRRPDQ